METISVARLEESQYAFIGLGTPGLTQITQRQRNIIVNVCLKDYTGILHDSWTGGSK
jgi:hypothetical protein